MLKDYPHLAELYNQTPKKREGGVETLLHSPETAAFTKAMVEVLVSEVDDEKRSVVFWNKQKGKESLYDKNQRYY